MININPRLENYIFDEIGAFYDTNYGSNKSLSHDMNENLKHLGKDFPKCFVEAYKIYDNLFNNKAIYGNFKNKEVIEILDIGSGSGGNLIGLLNILNNKFEEKNIRIYSIDSNYIALEYQKKFIRDIDKIFNKNRNNITITTLIHNFKDKNDILETINFRKQIENFEKFDIIQSFKFANKFYRQEYYSNQGAYKEILNIGENYLKENGLLIIEDITGKVTYKDNEGVEVKGDFISKIINNECREYFDENKESTIKYILPLSCAFWYKKCRSKNCFTKKEFNIRHRYNYNDISKITYKVFSTKRLGEEILGNKNNCHRYVYKISEDNKKNCSNYCICGKFHYGESESPTNAEIDAFDL